MQFNNRYVQLTALTIIIAVLLLLLEFIIFAALHIDFPLALRFLLAILASGYMVYKYLSGRIF